MADNKSATSTKSNKIFKPGSDEEVAATAVAASLFPLHYLSILIDNNDSLFWGILKAVTVLFVLAMVLGTIFWMLVF